MAHLFLKKVFKYKVQDKREQELKEYQYSSRDGFWINKNGEVCITNSSFVKPQTKKCDRETGEDKKGE